MYANPFGPKVFVFDELSGMDLALRGQARGVAAVPAGPGIGVAGLPPEAQAVVAGLRGLDARLDNAVMSLVKVAAEFGSTGAAARAIDSLVGSLVDAMRGQAIPGETDAKSLLVWAKGRATFVADAARELALERYGAAHGVPRKWTWRTTADGPRLDRRISRALDSANEFLDGLNKALKVPETAIDLFGAQDGRGLAESGSTLACMARNLADGVGGRVKVARNGLQAIGCTAFGKGVGAVLPDQVEDGLDWGMDRVEAVEEGFTPRVGLEPPNNPYVPLPRLHVEPPPAFDWARDKLGDLFG